MMIDNLTEARANLRRMTTGFVIIEQWTTEQLGILRKLSRIDRVERARHEMVVTQLEAIRMVSADYQLDIHFAIQDAEFLVDQELKRMSHEANIKNKNLPL